MPRMLLLSIHFHDGRYHGRPEWPPSPARLFQALLAGAASGKNLSAEDRTALAWLEEREAPIIAAPVKRDGGGFTNYVPNNDLDSVGRDPRRISEIRAGKQIKPQLFERSIGLLYAWNFDDGEDHARRLCVIAERLYQLGRGVDMAWARGEIIDADEIETRLATHTGAIYRPAVGGTGIVLPSPQKGSLASLERRFLESGNRFKAIKSGRQTQIYSQASKPRFAPVVYASPPQLFMFDLRELNDRQGLGSWPLARAVNLVERIRDLAAAALKSRQPGAATTIERIFIGRDAKETDKAERIRIVPLPSIGSPHVVPAIRRVLVEVPPNCPLLGTDIESAFSGILISEEVDSENGEVIETRLLPAEDRDMLRHYGVDDRNGHRVWRSVTPVALSEVAARRRIDPQRLRKELAATRGAASRELKESKSGAERLAEESRAAAAVLRSLRHSSVATRTEAIRLQREPFTGRGASAEDFAPKTRFAKERLWHVEITFAEPMRGPLVIGDGRYLGLGLMAPQRDAMRDTMAFAVPPQAGVAAADGFALAHAARRALMALARDAKGNVPRLFSGHEDGGGRAASGRHKHIFIAGDDNDGDGLIDRLIVAAPWACDRSSNPNRAERLQFDAVVSRLETLRAGHLGVIALGRPTGLSSQDALAGPAHLWESRTPYLATRHAGRRKDAAAMLARDITAECVRRGLPAPAEVEILECGGVANGGGLEAHAQLRFATAVRGPLLLGRDSHRGGGLFAAGGKYKQDIARELKN
jgi:CRISPR-associated protein Csb2